MGKHKRPDPALVAQCAVLGHRWSFDDGSVCVFCHATRDPQWVADAADEDG